MTFFVYENGKALFRQEESAEKKAAIAASVCAHFRRDYEEECFYEDEITCFNCRYRRWDREGFQCMKGGPQ